MEGNSNEEHTRSAKKTEMALTAMGVGGTGGMLEAGGPVPPRTGRPSPQHRSVMFMGGRLNPTVSLPSDGGSLALIWKG